MLTAAHNDPTRQRRRTTSFNHQRQHHHAMIPHHSQSSGSLSSRTNISATAHPSSKPATELTSIRERIAQLPAAERPFAIRATVSASANTTSSTTAAATAPRNSRLPRRQYFRLQKNSNSAFPVACPSQSEIIQRRRTSPPQQQQEEIHSIWMTNDLDEEEEDNEKDSPICQLLQETFDDILFEKDSVSAEAMVHRIRAHLDEQQSRIRQLESTHAKQLALDYRARFELEKRALLKQQQDQFETLKLKYRVGLEQIVDRWLSHEAAEQEQWMDQIQQQTEERVATLEARWKERTTRLQEQLRRYQG